MRFGKYGDFPRGGKLYIEEPRWFLGAKIKTTIIEAREAPQASKSNKHSVKEIISWLIHQQ
jgi:hypothetical protein